MVVSKEPRKVSPAHSRLDWWLCAILVCAAFGIVYWRSLTFVYVEGDDAKLVAYHAMGRNAELEHIYSPYISMFDAVLAVLPPREDIVRIAGMAITAISAPVLFFLIMTL